MVEHHADGESRLLRANDVVGDDASPMEPVPERFGLYRPEDVTEAVDRQGWLFVCRTELEADLLGAAGLAATVLAPSPLIRHGIPLRDVAETGPLDQARCVVPLDPGVVSDARVDVVGAAAASTTVVRLDVPLLQLAADGDDGVRALRTAVMAAPPLVRDGDDVWPVPALLLDPAVDVPSLAVDVLPGWVADQVRSVAAAMEVDESMAATLALGALSAVTAPGLRVQVTPSWQEGTNVYLVVGAESGERKSPVFRALFGPVDQIEQRQQAATRASVATTRRMVTIREKEARQAEAALLASDGDRESDLVAALEVALGRLEEARDRQREPFRLLVDDSSPEALTRILAAQGGSITIASTEGLLFDLVAGRVYGGGGGAVNLDPYLKGWSGDTLRVDRGGLRRSVHELSATALIREPRVTVAIATQPQPLLRAFTDPELDSRGLTNRFLPVLPPSLVGQRSGRAPAVDPDVAAGWAWGLERLAGRFVARPGPPEVLAVSDGAYDRWHQWWVACEAERGPGGGLHSISAWMSKVEAYVWRFAGLLAVADDPDATATVEAAHVERAVRLIGGFVGHRQALAAWGGTSPSVIAAKRLGDWLRASGVTVFSRRDAYTARANRPLFPHAEAVDEPLSMLVEAGWIRPLPVPRGPGRPSVKFAVNPHVHMTNPAAP